MFLRFDLTYEGLKFWTEREHVRRHQWFWSYLWGIEICDRKSSDRYPVRVLILPMRDWNDKLDCLRRLVIYFVLILPMRDWNTIRPRANRRRKYSFDLTYEGLKYSSSLRLCQNIEPFWSYLWGIEIKNRWFWTNCSTEVLILPMRDWNYQCSHVTSPHHFVLILPMRDWNSQKQN